MNTCDKVVHTYKDECTFAVECTYHLNLAYTSQILYNTFSTDSDLNSPACKSLIIFLFDMKGAYEENIFINLKSCV